MKQMKRVFITTVTLLICASSVISSDLYGELVRNELLVEELKAEIELAKKKNDLDQMYLLLRKLKLLKPTDVYINEELSQVESAISLYEQIKINRSEHNHEGVIRSAGEFLKYYPDDVEAREAFRESGLIFHHLKNAIDLISKCSMKTTQDKQILTNSTNFEEVFKNMEEINLENLVFNLTEAENATKKAKQFDPHFEKAIRIYDLLTSVKDNMSFLIANWCLVLAEAMSDGFYSLYDAYNGLTEKYYGELSPSDIWDGVKDKFSKAKSETAQIRIFHTKLTNLLYTLNVTEELEYITLTKEMFVNTKKLVDQACDPTDNIYSQRHLMSMLYNEHKDLKSKMIILVPDEEVVLKKSNHYLKEIDSFEIFKEPEIANKYLEKHNKILGI